MNKFMLLLGLLLTAVLFYFCWDFSGKKEVLSSNIADKTAVEDKNYLKEQNSLSSKNTQIQAAASAVSENALASKKEPKTNPSFNFEDRDGVLYIKAVLSSDDKNSSILQEIDKMCQNVECKKDITFLDNKNRADWSGYAVRILGFFKDKGVENSKLIIDERSVLIDGEFPKEEDKEEFLALLDPFVKEGFKIDDKTSIKVLQTPKDGENQTPKESKESNSIKDIESKISKLLSLEPVRFKLSSSKITKKSENTLNKAIELLDSLPDDVNIEVAGYTDARGDKNYNLILSQKRAEAVRDYLKSHMKTNKNIVAKGYGASHFIAGNPLDIKNRRVEIHLNKGE